MGSQAKKETLYPQCLSLRVHSSILLPIEKEAYDSNSDENDILLLPDDIVLGSTEHPRVGTTNFEGNNASHEGHVCTREDHAGISHVFLMAENQNQKHDEDQQDTDINNNDNNNNSFTSRFDFVASSDTRQRIVVQPTAGKIKDFGRRARARSQQQRQNRKGIKVIDDSSLIADQVQKQTIKKGGSSSKSIINISSSNTNSGKKRLRQHYSQTQQLPMANNTAKTARRKTGQLLWTPDISQIPIPSKDTQSSYVQLHGLPIGSTFDIIRKFFTGLLPERILLLLSNRTDISALDSSSYYTLPSYNLQDFVYTNKDMRVLVKFDSISAAGLAVDRSGETIFSKHISTLKHFYREDGEKLESRGVSAPPDSFSIGVTKISKDLAFSLSRLSVDALPGVPLHDCLFKVESKLDPLVREILWTSAHQQECHVAVDSEIKSAKLFQLLPSTLAGYEEESINGTNLLTFSGYQKYANHHNRLLRMQEDLMASMPNNNSDDDEDTISMDPIVRLTAHACMVLGDEMDRIDILLYQCRAIKFL